MFLIHCGRTIAVTALALSLFACQTADTKVLSSVPDDVPYQKITGTWNGTSVAGNQRSGPWELVFKGERSYMLFDGPESACPNEPMSVSVSIEGNKYTIQSSGCGANFAGTVEEGGDRIELGSTYNAVISDARWHPRR